MRVTVVLTSIAAVLHSTVAFSPLLPCHDGFRQQRVTRHRLDRARCSGGGNGSRFALEEDNDEGSWEYDRLTFENVRKIPAAAVFVCILFSLCACNAIIMGTRDVFDDIRDFFNKVKVDVFNKANVDVCNNHDSVYVDGDVGNDVGNGVGKDVGDDVDGDVDNGVGDDVGDDFFNKVKVDVCNNHDSVYVDGDVDDDVDNGVGDDVGDDFFNKVKVDVFNNHDSVYVDCDVDDDVDNGVGDDVGGDFFNKVKVDVFNNHDSVYVDGDVGDDVDDNDPLFPPRIAAIIERVKMTRSISDIRFTNAGTLVLDIPPRGMTVRSAMIGASLSTAGLFVVGSLSGPLVSGVYGGFVAKFMVVNPFVSTHITIGQHTWSLERRYCGDTDAFTESSTDQLVRASLKTKSSMFSDEMEGKLYLYTKKPRMRKVRLAAGLPLEEQQLLEGVINDYLDHRSCGDSE